MIYLKVYDAVTPLAETLLFLSRRLDKENCIVDCRSKSLRFHKNSNCKTWKFNEISKDIYRQNESVTNFNASEQREWDSLMLNLQDKLFL